MMEGKQSASARCFAAGGL